jgi:hypothetical protein
MLGDCQKFSAIVGPGHHHRYPDCVHYNAQHDH